MSRSQPEAMVVDGSVDGSVEGAGGDQRAPGGTPGHRRPALLAALAAVLVVAAAVLAYFAHRESQLAASSALRASALAAARQEAVNFTTYDYRHLSQDFARVSAAATGSFRKEFQTESGSLAQLIGQSKAVATGRVLDAGLVSISSTGATAVVALDDRVTNSVAPNGVVRNYRLKIVLARSHGRWLVANLQPVA